MARHRKSTELDKATAIDYTNKFISYVQSQGYKIGIYTGLSFYYEYLQGHVPNVPLWLASYGKQPQQYPNLVSWQYSGKWKFVRCYWGCGFRLF
ncbi:GH25 family lysozyme M1 (1,4-beta-N-acetylmuramidase) [Clostridium acetobutylicum]|nr:GH25 family lysozyme M1 (1,4-beta-N-acetylmuramidase) [Clostridium acetobutylicum]